MKELKEVMTGQTGRQYHGRARSVPGRFVLALVVTLLTGCVPVSENGQRDSLKQVTRARPSLDANGETTTKGAIKDETTDGAPKQLGPGTLADYLAYALKHRPALVARFEQWQAAVYRIASARRLPNPQINYRYYISQVETRVGPQRHKVSLQQAFPWPTKLSAGADAAAHRAAAEERLFDAAAIDVTAAVTRDYWRLWALREQLKIHQEHVAVLESLSQSASARIRVGSGTLADQQQIDLTTAKVADQVEGVKKQIVSAEAALRQTVGLADQRALPVTEEPVTWELSESREGLLKDALNHPAILQFDELKAADNAAAQSARADRLPGFQVGIDWIETGPAKGPSVGGDGGKDAFLVGMGISVPLWQTNVKQEVAAHRAMARVDEAQKRDAINGARAKITRYLAEAEDALRRVNLYEHTLIPQADTVFNSALGGFVSGQSTVAALLLAQRDLLWLRIELIGERAKLAIAYARLSQVVGRPVVLAGSTKLHNEEKQK